jgi:hypothetical protein
MKVAALRLFAGILDKEIAAISSEDKETELAQAQQAQKDFLDAAYQNVKASIKENEFYVDLNTFRPTRRIVLEIGLEVIDETFLDVPKEKVYEVVGRAICEEFAHYEQADEHRKVYQIGLNE